MKNPQEPKPISTTAGSGLSRLRGANSTRVLIAVNTIPAVGVLFFGWDAFNVVFLFWLENLVIGFFAVLKMVTAGSGQINIANLVKQIPMVQLRSSVSSRVDAAQMKSTKVFFQFN